MHQGDAVYNAHRVFTFGAPATCREAFNYAGKPYAKGAAFPYVDLGLTSYDLYGLWQSERIDFARQASAVKQEKQIAARR